MQRLKLTCYFFLTAWLVNPIASYASFIETTLGTAVVNDATATYYNPAALMLLKNTQIIPLITVARFHTEFSGQSTAIPTNFTEFGSSNSSTYYYSPSFYFATPLTAKLTAGLAFLSNYANRDPESASILRYVQSSNSIQDYDLVPSFGIKMNEYLSIGAGINLSYLRFDLHPITGFPGSNIADSQSNNQSDGSGVGGNIGFLLQPNNGSLIGFNYRSITTYNESGTSHFNGATPSSTSNYHFQLRTPARSVLSISQVLTPTTGLIATVQRIQWSITRNINIYNIATPSGITSASVPYHLQDSWVFTLGGNYQFKPNWIVRTAATYNQSPENGNNQISTGDSYIVGISLGYKLNNMITLDGSYAHAFIQDQNINIHGSRFIILGNNQGARDVVSLKMTVNV